MSEEELQAHFATLPARYFQIHPAKEILADLILAHRFMRLQISEEENALAPVVNWHNEPDRGYNAVKICTWDRAGLFRKIAGSLSAAGLNILSAQIFTRTDDIVLDTFFVADAVTGNLAGPDQRDRFESVLHKALTGEEVDFHALIGRQKITRPLYQAYTGEKLATQIRLDNDASEARTADRNRNRRPHRPALHHLADPDRAGPGHLRREDLHRARRRPRQLLRPRAERRQESSRPNGNTPSSTSSARPSTNWMRGKVASVCAVAAERGLAQRFQFFAVIPSGSRRQYSIDPEHEPSHPPFVSGILGELLPEPAFFPARLGVKQRRQGQRCQQCRPTAPKQSPADRTAEHRRVERMAHQPIHARLDQLGAGGRFGKRRQVSAQPNHPRETATGGDQQKERANQTEGEALPLVAAEQTPCNNRAQKHALAQHPKPAPSQKTAAHACHIAQEINNFRFGTRDGQDDQNEGKVRRAVLSPPPPAHTRSLGPPERAAARSTIVKLRPISSPRLVPWLVPCLVRVSYLSRTRGVFA